MVKSQLFCIPFAGGNANSFQELVSHLDDRVDVVKIEYPGRGIRREEPFHETIDELIDDVASLIEQNRKKDLKFAILGYSLGSAITYELVNRHKLNSLPCHLFISAREALDEQSESKKYSNLKPEEFMEKIRELGGMDERILKNKRFLSIYMKPILEDYKLWRQYNYTPSGTMPCIDMTVFYSEMDTPFDKVERWRNFTDGKVAFYEFGFNHFFIREHAREMAQIINTVLMNLE